MSARAQINYHRPAHYLFREQNGAWYSFGPMPLFKAVLLAIGKYRVNNESVVYSHELSLIGIDAILAVRQRADFPLSLTFEGAPKASGSAVPGGDKPVRG
jgi:hypothetical protein